MQWNRKSVIYIFGTLFHVITSSAVVLEDLVKAGKLEETFANQRIGYYMGSFDPLHNSHEAIPELITREGHCDKVLVCAAFGGDSQKQRTDIDVRLKMLYSVFKDHPDVIVTSYNPQELQKLLTVADEQKPDFVQPKFAGLKFVGILGSDATHWMVAKPQDAANFMGGAVVPDKYAEHTYGNCRALPVTEFLIIQRTGDDGFKESTLIGKPARAITMDVPAVSSTEIRTKVAEGSSIETLVPLTVVALIKEHTLYR